MTKVYVVIGESGEYSDRRDWTVCAYLSEDMARRHVELQATAPEYDPDQPYETMNNMRLQHYANNIYDPDGHTHVSVGDDTQYFCSMPELREELP